MTAGDGLDSFRDGPEAAESDPKEAPDLFYGSVNEFVRDRLRYLYKRKVGATGSRRWSAKWWDNAEATSRLEALWRAWETLRLDAGLGVAVWWRDYADPTMAALMSPEGPFAKSEDANAPDGSLPHEEPAPELFPDMRLIY